MNNINFIKPTVEVIKSNLSTIQSIKGGREDLTFAEVSQIFLMNELGYTQIQAQDVYEELEKGFEEYTAKQEALQVDKSAIVTSIIEATATYSPEERTSIYINVLTSMQLINETKSCDDIEILRAKNSSLSDDELIAEIIATLDGLPFLYVMDGIKDGITPDGIAMLGDAKDMRTKEFKIAAALILYTAQKKGSVTLAFDDTDISPRIIGAMASAGVDALSVTSDLQEDRISVSLWKKILKCILGALFSIIFAALCTFAILSINLIIVSFIFSVFGLGLIATLLFVPAIFYFTKNAIKVSEQEYTKLADKIYPIFDLLIEKVALWAENAIDKIKEWINAVHQKVLDASLKINVPKQNEGENTDTVAVTPILA